MLFPLFDYFNGCWLGNVIRNSIWLFPAIESVHLLALATLGGAVLTVDLRMMGILFKKTPIVDLARDVEPFFAMSLILMLASGILLMIDEPLRCYYSPAFWIKVSSLGLAIIWAYTIRFRVARREESRVAPALLRTVAIVSIVLWSGVGLGGRGIAFY
jgi:hypothetical protein